MATRSGSRSKRSRDLRGSGAIVALLLTSAIGCGSSRVDRVKAAQQTAEKEQTPEKLVARGKLFAQMGDQTRAGQYFSAALDAGAKPAEVLPLLMRTYIATSPFRNAIAVGEQYLKKFPRDSRLRFLVATLYLAIEEPEHAREHLDHILAQDMNNADAHYVLAVLLRDHGDYVGADQHFRQYLKLKPEGPHAEEARGSLLKSLP